MTTKVRAWLFSSAMLFLAIPAPTWAQPAESDDVTTRLIDLLVKKGVVKRDEAVALLQEVKAGKAPTKKPKAMPTAAVPNEPEEEKIPPGTVRVTYVPQIVRDQIAEQVRSEMMQASNGGTPGGGAPAEPGAMDRFHFFGDLRLRGEWDQLPGGNAPQFPDFATINSGSPYDITGASGAVPLLDTTEDRSRFRLRARAGVDVQIDDGLSAEVRIATGNDASPVSANQTLGQNGPFAKYAIWLDRAYVKEAPNEWLSAYAGRMPNPYWTTDLMYYDDLAFDGVAISASPRISKRMTGFFTAGAFPVFNTSFNFGSTSENSAYASRDGWLFAVQGGGEWKATKQITTKFGAGYFAYSNISGKISSPCTIVFSSDTCNTDNTRALFPGNGNTMMAVRSRVIAPNNTQPQYFGLASPFRILDLHGRVDLTMFEPIVIAFETEFADNLAFDRAQTVARGVNNFSGTTNQPDTGNKAWMVRATVGYPTVTERWDWNVSLTYKYLESDSVLASLNDPDFHLGGTNAKGFILAGNLGIARNTWLTARWLSSTQVSGAPFAVDVFQADLNVKF
jgi:hypothetical protein